MKDSVKQNNSQALLAASLAAILMAGGAAHAALAEEVPCYEVSYSALSDGPSQAAE